MKHLNTTRIRTADVVAEAVEISREKAPVVTGTKETGQVETDRETKGRAVEKADPVPTRAIPALANNLYLDPATMNRR